MADSKATSSKKPAGERGRFAKFFLGAKKFKKENIVRAGGVEQKHEVKALVGEANQLTELMDVTLHNLQYDGFSAVRCRAEVMGAVEAEAIIVAVAAYVRIGNNPLKAVGKVLGPMEEVINIAAQIKPHTLARLGIAFMPLLYYTRHHARASLQRQFALDTDPVICDPAFQGWIGDEIIGFLNAFDTALNANKPGLNRRPVMYWIDLARNGLVQDPGMQALMQEVRKDPALGLRWFEHLYRGHGAEFGPSRWKQSGFQMVFRALDEQQPEEE